jgi:hypothetical protein
LAKGLINRMQMLVFFGLAMSGVVANKSST